MTNLFIVENKIGAIKEYLGILKGFKKFSYFQLADDVFIRGSVELYLYLAAQSAIDLAESVIALKDYRKPTTLKEGFEILEEEGVISIELRNAMRDMAGFRNIIAHDYAKIDYSKVYDIVQNRLPDVEKFSTQIKKYLNLR